MAMIYSHMTLIKIIGPIATFDKKIPRIIDIVTEFLKIIVDIKL